ncbi:hypothetical protein ABN262_23415, partial [Citrobacter youngae]|uniref:hypothetical protein n=1 Tax=Citrobacter youngae TaxID=133448 RepID=UPI0032DA9322
SINMVEEARERQEEHVQEFLDYDPDDDDAEPVFLGYGKTGMSEIIHSFSRSGKPVYWFKDPISNHCFFDLCEDDCKQCYPAEEPHKRPSCKPSRRRRSKRKDNSDDEDSPSPPPMPLQRKKKALKCYEQEYLRKEPMTVPVPPVIPAMVISKSYEEDFPPLKSFQRGGSMQAPKIPAPNEV